MRESSSVVAGRVMKGVAIAGAAGAGWVALQWLRYGHPVEGADGDRDALLDRFMPTPDVVERHRIVVGAPAEITLDAAARMELGRLPVVRAVFAAREWGRPCVGAGGAACSLWRALGPSREFREKRKIR